MPLADAAEFKPDFVATDAGTALLYLCELRIFCALMHRTGKRGAEIIKKGFSGNQEALRLLSKKKPAQSQVK